jgi:hypothetical protein
MEIWTKIKTLLNIALLMLVSYIIMVFISHFSVYHKTDNYQIIDSFDAMLFKTDVPAEFIVYFGVHIVLVVIIVLFINSIVKKFKKQKSINN